MLIHRLGYKRSKIVTYAIEALCKNDWFFHNRLKVLENRTLALAKAMFNDLQALKTRINGYDKDLDILNQAFRIS